MTNVLLAGGHATLLGAIAARLEYEHGCRIVGAAATAAEAASINVQHPPDIALVEVDEKDTVNSADLAALHARHPLIRIILVGSRIEDGCVERTLALGANGFLLRSSLPTEIGAALDEVLCKGVYFPRDDRAPRSCASWTTGAAAGPRGTE